LTIACRVQRKQREIMSIKNRGNRGTLLEKNLVPVKSGVGKTVPSVPEVRSYQKKGRLKKPGWWGGGGWWVGGVGGGGGGGEQGMNGKPRSLEMSKSFNLRGE